MRSLNHRLAVCVVLFLGAAGCRHTGSSGNDAADADGDADADAHGFDHGPIFTADCGAILLVPPVIEVHSSRDGSAICNVDFTVVAVSPDDGTFTPYALAAGSCEETPSFGCPEDSDGAVPTCTFSLGGLASLASSRTSYSVQVSSAGFQPAVVVGVQEGLGGCVTPRAATSNSVALDPT